MLPANADAYTRSLQPMNNADHPVQRLISTTRAYVQIAKVADLLLDQQPAWTEWLLLQLVRALYSHRLRGLVAELPSEMTAEILAASEKMMGPVRRFTDN